MLFRKQLWKKSVRYTAALSSLMAATFALAAFKPELTPKPNPPDAGENMLEIIVTDEAGKSVDDANIEVFLFMPAMATMPRMEEKSETKVKGKGVYETSFVLPMGGTWEITLSIEKDGKTQISHHSLTTGIPGVMNKDSGNEGGQTGVEQVTNLMALGPDRLQKAGVRFAEARITPLTRVVEAVGVVEQDQTHREELTLRYSGYIVKQFRGRVGDSVKAGDPLFSVYSPDLVAAQSEFLLASQVGGSLRDAAEIKLKNLGLSERDIAQILRDGKTKRDIVIRSPIKGTILEVKAREGAAANAGQVIYVIGDLSKSYIVARIFQQDIGDLKVGQMAEAALPNAGEKIKGRVDLIYPQVEQGAGTTNVRVEVEAPFAAALRPGVYVDLSFPVELGNLLAVPVEAVLYSGKHRYVFVDHGEGALEPREIEIGKTVGDLVEVQAGLKEGDRIVASGTFLVGSEAQLRSALPKWKSDKKSGVSQ